MFLASYGKFVTNNTKNYEIRCIFTLQFNQNEHITKKLFTCKDSKLFNILITVRYYEMFFIFFKKFFISLITIKDLRMEVLRGSSMK